MPLPARNTLAIVGAGPIGLEAAAAAVERGFDVHVFERGEPGAHAIAWGHVRMFTPWSMNLGPASARLLARHGWSAPDPDARPTGAELVERLIAPLAATPELASRLHAHAQVVQVSRLGALRGDGVGTPERREHPFRLMVRDSGGRESYLHAFSLIDASGVYGTPRAAGTGGIPARGEQYLAPQLSYHCNDVRGLRRERHAGRRTLVIGSGACAATTVAELAALAVEAPGTSVAWVTRRPAPRLAGEIGGADPLPARAALHAAAHAFMRGEHAAVTWIGGAEVDGFEYNSATHRYRVTLLGASGNRVEEADEIVVNTGYGPDGSLHRELQVRELDGPPAPGADAFESAEPGFWIVGAKSFGRANTFLLRTGFEQVARALDGAAQALREPASR
ncbi:MAG TPA: NAD(P)-binding protein [Candidatus Acidoferrales bacterium]|nr:NAD(P)-binding protein [Candidatus Acidoferrales bacterium]